MLRYPNVSPALLGSARAAQRAGEAVTARDRFAALATQWKNADPGVPELDEARAGARTVRTTRR